MDLHRHPELTDRLAAAYALGALRGPARRRFETLARRHPAIGAAAHHWQERLAGLTELQPAATPAPQVWQRIHNLVRAEAAAPRRAPAPRARWWNSLNAWRGAALAGALASVAMVVVSLRVQEHWRGETAAQIAALRQQIETARAPQYVAVLLDAQAAPALLVTLDAARGQLQLQRVGAYREQADKSLQLWALPRRGGPQSLGVLTREASMRLRGAAADWPTVDALAVSLEPLGGVPGAGGPTGPVLFKGALIQRML